VKVYEFPIAPNPRKLRVYLGEKQIPVEYVRVSLPEGEQRQPEFLKKNPAGNLPVLELDDGTFLTESLAIIEYLEELHPEPCMIGTTPLERARVRKLERWCELGVLVGVGRWFHGTLAPLPGAEPNPAIADWGRQSVQAPLRRLEDEMRDGRPFVAGDRPSIADCTLFAAFELAHFSKLEIPAELAHLHRWHADFSSRPSAQP